MNSDNVEQGNRTIYCLRYDGKELEPVSVNKAKENGWCKYRLILM